MQRRTRMASQEAGNNIENQSNAEATVARGYVEAEFSLPEGIGITTTIQPDRDACGYDVAYAPDNPKDAGESTADEDLETPTSEGPLLRDSLPIEDTPGLGQGLAHLPAMEIGSSKRSSSNDSKYFDARTKEDIIQSVEVSTVQFQATSAEQTSFAGQSPIVAPDSPGQPQNSLKDTSLDTTHILRKDFDPMTGRKVLNNYELIDKLGSGQHGTVKLGRNLETNAYVAVKIVRRFSKKLRLGKTGNPNDTIKKEVAILKKARHPHVVSLFEVIDDDEFDKVYLVLEYVERGEIVWRKTTDKAVAQFEMERHSRERANGFDEVFESQAVKEFNAGVSARRLEKARRLEEQRRQARERMASGHTRPHYSSADPFWSLEHGAESENEYIVTAHHRHHREGSRLSRADVRAAEHAGESPQSATPVYTPTFMSQALHAEFTVFQPSSQPTSAPPSISPSQPNSQPASQPASPPETPSLDGTMYGPYIEDKSKSDIELQSMLDRVIAEQREHWSPEEEEHRYVPCLTLTQALEAFRDTVLGLEFLHYQGIIHRDIKPANLLWTTDYRVKISDFGVSYLGKPIREDSNHEEIPEADAGRVDEALELAKTVGTPAFYAPELCDPQYFEIGKNRERPDITGQIDVWALGVTLYGMVFGRLPFFDPNEFRMYEKIAHDEVFISRRRLKGVEHTDKTPSNHNKRMDDVLEYEEIDDTLQDLLKKLLAKQPGQRISLKEVKHHPWVVSGIENKERWLEETDPSRQSEGKRIEVSNQEVQDAVVGVTLVDRIKTSVQRLSSVLRGRSSRKRTDSHPKLPESIGSTTTPKSREDRRASLMGDEQIFSALKASREGGEHPLAQSVAASPEVDCGHSYFTQDRGDPRPQSAIEASNASRPPISERSMSTADSMKTIKAYEPNLPRQSILHTPKSLATEDFATTTTTVVDPSNNSSSSSLGGIFGGAGRRLVNSMRSRERGLTRQSLSQSSRSSSVDTNTHISAAEDYHASPSLGFSCALAAGHVDLPPALREEVGVEGYHLPNPSSADSFKRAQEINIRRHQAEYVRQIGGHRRSVSYAADKVCPPSPDDDVFFRHYQLRPASAAESSFAISSSSDQIVSSESTAHSRIPSVVSGASSLSATIEEDHHQPSLPFEKSISPLTTGRRSVERPRSQIADETLNTATALTRAAAEEEAGYNGEGEQDSDSEDEGLAMSIA
ncbi:MAG: hypothetical protein Q9217_004069 [Psora testacea]